MKWERRSNLFSKFNEKSMKSLWPKYKIPIIFASIGALFHLIFVVYPLVASGYRGEGIAMWLGVVDFPLMLLEMAIPWLGRFIGTSTAISILYYSIFGTLMYVLVGWVFGWILYYLSQLLKQP